MGKFQVDDVVFNVATCDHCGKSATEAEAHAAVRRYLDQWGKTICCVCGGEIRILSFEIEHGSLGGGVMGWFAYPTLRNAPVTIRLDRDTVNIVDASLHEHCARAAMPYLAEEFWIQNERSPLIISPSDR